MPELCQNPICLGRWELLFEREQLPQVVDNRHFRTELMERLEPAMVLRNQQVSGSSPEGGSTINQSPRGPRHASFCVFVGSFVSNPAWSGHGEDAGLAGSAPNSRSISSAESRSLPSKRCPYVSIGSLIEECPRRSDIFFGWTPSWIESEACVCRRS